MSDKASAAFGLAMMAAIIALVGFFPSIAQYPCKKRWEESGMAAKFSWGAGCQLEVSKGKWIPEDRYREIP
jgi:hypothetical protein